MMALATTSTSFVHQRIIKNCNMKARMWAVYDSQTKRLTMPRSIHFTKWSAEHYIKDQIPKHVKTRIVRVEVVMKSETAFDIYNHEYKRI